MINSNFSKFEKIKNYQQLFYWAYVVNFVKPSSKGFFFAVFLPQLTNSKRLFFRSTELSKCKLCPCLFYGVYLTSKLGHKKIFLIIFLPEIAIAIGEKNNLKIFYFFLIFLCGIGLGGLFTFLLLNITRSSSLISKLSFQDDLEIVKIPKIWDPLFWAGRITFPTPVSLLFISIMMGFQISLRLEIFSKKIEPPPLPQPPKLDEPRFPSWWLGAAMSISDETSPETSLEIPSLSDILHDFIDDFHRILSLPGPILNPILKKEKKSYHFPGKVYRDKFLEKFRH